MELYEFDPNFGHWLAGFIDGEGCFDIAKTKNRNGGHSYYCRFSLRLRDDDSSIINEIQRKLGIGSISVVKRKDASKPQIQWSVSGREDCLKLVSILDRFSLRAKKARDYAVWRRAVFYWSSLKFSENGQERFDQLQNELRDGRRYPAL